jgi:hypothetical protein
MTSFNSGTIKKTMTPNQTVQMEFPVANCCTLLLTIRIVQTEKNRRHAVLPTQRHDNTNIEVSAV